MTMNTPEKGWEEEFDEKWDGCFSDESGDYVNPQVKAFISSVEQHAYDRGLKEGAEGARRAVRGEIVIFNPNQ